MIWPFRRYTDRDRERDRLVDERLSNLSTQIAQADRVVEANAPRVHQVRSRAEQAAAARAEAIRQNHLDQLFIQDLRGHTT